MKLTKSKLKQLVKEELENILTEGPEQVIVKAIATAKGVQEHIVDKLRGKKLSQSPDYMALSNIISALEIWQGNIEKPGIAERVMNSILKQYKTLKPLRIAGVLGQQLKSLQGFIKK